MVREPKSVTGQGNTVPIFNYNLQHSMIGYIYKTTNILNNKIYIGKHSSNTYDPTYFGSGKILKQAIKNTVEKISLMK